MALTTLTEAQLKQLPADLRKLVEKQQQEAQLLQKVSEGKISLKVSEKKAVSVYGMGRWPVTLYKEQWLRLLDSAQTIRDFIDAHDGELKTKLQAAAEGLEEGSNGNGNGNGAGKESK